MFINGISVWSKVLTDGTLAIEHEFSEEVLTDVAAGTALDIAFNLPDAESPSNLHISPDGQLLTLGLHGIEIF